jgi:hypothetical protein
MDAVIAFVSHIPWHTWSAIGLLIFLPLAVLVLIGRVNDGLTRQRDWEAFDGYSDPAYRFAQSPAARPRVVRGAFKRGVPSPETSPISGSCGSGDAA